MGVGDHQVVGTQGGGDLLEAADGGGDGQGAAVGGDRAGGDGVVAGGDVAAVAGRGVG